MKLWGGTEVTQATQWKDSNYSVIQITDAFERWVSSTDTKVLDFFLI